MQGEHIDLASNAESTTAGAAKRSFVGVRFLCCDVYVRIYINRTRTAYEGHCPKCARPIRIRIGPEGTDCRFFVAY